MLHNKYIFAAIFIPIAATITWLAITFAHRNNMPSPTSQFPNDQPNQTPLAVTRPFDFTCAIGSGQEGFNTLKVYSDGRCEYTYMAAPGSWRRTRWIIPVKMVNNLEDVVAAESFISLKSQYQSDIADGYQWYFRLRTSKGEKSVFCNNHFPDPARHIADFCQTKIIAANPRLQIDSAGVSEEEAKTWPIP